MTGRGRGTTRPFCIFGPFTSDMELVMSRTACEIGDRVKLRASATQSALISPFGVIVGLLPTEDRGEPRFRLRVDGETFERSVLATDIEHAETATPDPAQAEATGPWLKKLSAKRGR